MPHNIKRKLILVAIFKVFTPVNVQYAMPMYMPPPMYAMPAPMPVAVAIHLPERRTTTTTTTTTTPEPSGFAIAMPVPVPMPFAIPAPPPPVFCQARNRPKGCPPCPPCVCLPSCTPAFFSYCSPCHQKCRCRNPEDAPIPMPPPGQPYPLPVPVPIVGPPPIMVVPVPPVVRIPQFRRSSSNSDEISDSSDSSRCKFDDSSSSCDSKFNRRRRKFWMKVKKRKQMYRRKLNEGDANEGSDSEFVRPVLSYVSENGDVKYETKISKNDAMNILREGKTKNSDRKQTVNVVAGDDSVVVSSNSRKSGRRYDKVLLRNSPTNHVLREGNNQLIFKSPNNKKIKNVAVSFQVAR